MKKPIAMIQIYIDLVKLGAEKGGKSIEDVPETIREDVRQALLDSSNN